MCLPDYGRDETSTGEPVKCVAIVFRLRPHRERNFQKPNRSSLVAQLRPAQGQAEVSVVVGRVKLDRSLELLAGPPGLPAVIQGAGQGLAQRPLCRFEAARPLEDDGRLMVMAAGDQTPAFVQKFVNVCVFHSKLRLRAASIPIELRPLGSFSPLMTFFGQCQGFLVP